MESSVFMVNEEPYCIWESDIQQRNFEFLKGIDVDYFDFVLQTIGSSEDEKRASIALRITYHHALETLFSLIGALVQAPRCVYAWVAKCRTRDLKQVTEKIGIVNVNLQKEVLPHSLNLDHISWQAISEIVFSHYLPGTARNQSTVELFGRLWKRLAAEFLDDRNSDEYNSLKHGFRIRSGGFSLAAGIEDVPGTPAPESAMKMVGSSEYGTSHIRVERIGGDKGNRCLQSKKVASNWSLEGLILQLHLTSMSISNVVTALQIINGEKGSTLKFHRPEDDAEFERAWSYSPGVIKLTYGEVLDESTIPYCNKKDLLKLLEENKSSDSK